VSNHPNLSPVADIISVGAVVGSIMHALPPLAAVVAILWYCLEIWESDTVRDMLQDRRRKERVKRLRRLRRRHRLHRRTVPETKTPPVS